MSHSFGATAVLANFDLSVEEGQFVCLLGPSGSGKTTILRIVAGLLTPTRGSVLINGVDQEHIPTHKRNIGLVFQTPNALLPHLNVFDNVAFPFRHGKRPSPSRDWRENVHRILQSVRLDVHAKSSIATLSGGEKQRVAIARALVYRPALLLLDEPLSSLDNELKIDLRELMLSLHRETASTFIYVTHDEREAVALGTHIAVLSDGRLQQYGSVEEVTRRPGRRRVAEIVGGWAVLRAVVQAASPPALVLPGSAGIPIPAGAPTTAGQVTVAIPARGIAVQLPGHPAAPDTVTLPATVSSTRAVYAERRTRCQLADGQVVDFTDIGPATYHEGHLVEISFRQEDVHVLQG